MTEIQSAYKHFIPTSKMYSTWHQQVLALDAKYNTQRASKLPTLGMLYIRRRNQLLREKPFKEHDIRTQYLKLRLDLLNKRYGDNIEQTNITNNTLQKETSDNLPKSNFVPKKSTAENFAFTGVHHVFDQHTAAVIMLKFANNDRSRLGCASLDGTLSICEVINTPPQVLVVLEGHQKGVTAFDWSISNDLIVSSSLDATIRLWKVQVEPKCLRVVKDPQNAEIFCCAFIPANNNLVVTGNSHGLIQILNVSTGIYTRGGSCKLGEKVLSLTCEESGGSLIWAGSDRGTITSLQFEPRRGRLYKLQRVQKLNGMVTGLSWRSWHSKEMPYPVFLASTACNAVLLYRVEDNQGSLTLLKKYPIKHRLHCIKSTFCPQMGACLIATGSEDCAIHLFDSSKDGKAARVNLLHGHTRPVLTLSFNYDESFLASADHQGLIILWRNHQRHL
ncbi:PREDICTED: WD repeat-containing protein 13-like [Polistes dominula]|uniref:WD repeat-containing protein 13-like n=1 Tax=Polistes dominula TaxID=743375 RepID=A0ABM1JFU4_POLDO|nr:PREDICTED: WD repeat-containing protein 13-like [Polistes dominula]XP_015191332.1 PREDICTED: WD repeat-containing protein 13-like [Polistes dominula]